MKRIIAIVLLVLIAQLVLGQDYGDFPKIEKEKLWSDLELLHQGLDKLHTGMYWYTPKDSVDAAFEMAKLQIDSDLNVLEFHKIIAPLVALSREDHTNVYLPETVKRSLKENTLFLPLTVVFLGEELYCVKNGSNIDDFDMEGKVITSINGEPPSEIVNKIGTLFASDGFIKTVKYSDLNGFSFALYYFYYHGRTDRFEIVFEGEAQPIIMESQNLATINKQLKNRYPETREKEKQAPLELVFVGDSVAYLGIHDFSNSEIKEHSQYKRLSKFLKHSFQLIADCGVQTLIVDVSKNTGGSEGNEGLLYSYFGENYQKYTQVLAKTPKAVLDNGVDPPKTLKTYGFAERIFTTKTMPDGSLERTQVFGKGLMAYKKEPKYKFEGEVYVIISPLTYSGGSEFSNMMYSQGLATFVGQETGGGYYGNTSGYMKQLILPNSRIEVYIPTLHFVMNVSPTLPFGRGVIPHYKVIPTFEEYINGENASLNFILEILVRNP